MQCNAISDEDNPKVKKYVVILVDSNEMIFHLIYLSGPPDRKILNCMN